MLSKPDMLCATNAFVACSIFDSSSGVLHPCYILMQATPRPRSSKGPWPSELRLIHPSHGSSVRSRMALLGIIKADSGDYTFSLEYMIMLSGGEF